MTEEKGNSGRHASGGVDQGKYKNKENKNPSVTQTLKIVNA